MTIAIGYPCRKGVIVAADTNEIVSLTEKRKGCKLTTFTGKNDGVYAIVDATDNAIAAKVLIDKIQWRLTNTEIKSLEDFSECIVEQMTEWHDQYGYQPTPIVSLLVAFKVAGHGVRLYHCQPPNVVTQQNGYYAIGEGASVTDPLKKYLFNILSDTSDVQTVLRTVAYLMYRAKKDSRHCEGDTHCAIVSLSHDEPVIVPSLEMERAEKHSTELDFLIHTLSTFVLQSADADSGDDTEKILEKNAQGLAKMMTDFKDIRTPFHDVYGDEIKL